MARYLFSKNSVGTFSVGHEGPWPQRGKPPPPSDLSRHQIHMGARPLGHYSPAGLNSIGVALFKINISHIDLTLRVSV